MGYTHYWHVKRNADPMKIGRAVVDMARVIQSNAGILAGWDGTGRPDIAEGIVRFNGRDEDSHETFSFPPDLTEEPPDHREDKTVAFGFCKTARKPYDEVVTACLAIAKHYLGDEIEVESDGYPDEWDDGLALARHIVGEEVANPIA